MSTPSPSTLTLTSTTTTSTTSTSLLHHPTCILDGLFDLNQPIPSAFHSVADYLKARQLCTRFPAVVLGLLSYFQEKSLPHQQRFLIQLQSHHYHCFSTPSIVPPLAFSIHPLLGHAKFPSLSSDPRIKPKGLPLEYHALQHPHLEDSSNLTLELSDLEIHHETWLNEENQNEEIASKGKGVENKESEVSISNHPVSRNTTLPVSKKLWKKEPKSNSNRLVTSSPSSLFSMIDANTIPKNLLYRILHHLRSSSSTLLALHCLNTHWLRTMNRYLEQYPLLFVKFQPYTHATLKSTSLPLSSLPSPPLLDESEKVYQAYFYSFRDPLLYPYHPQAASLYKKDASQPLYHVTLMGNTASFPSNATLLPVTLSLSFLNWMTSIPWLTHFDLLDPNGESFPYEMANLCIQNLASTLEHLHVQGPFALAGNFPRLTTLRGSHGVILKMATFPRLQHLYVHRWEVAHSISLNFLLTQGTLETCEIRMNTVPEDPLPLKPQLPKLLRLHVSRRWLTDVLGSVRYPRLQHLHVMGCPEDVAKHASRFLNVSFSSVSSLTFSNHFEIDHHVCKQVFRNTPHSSAHHLRSLTLRFIQVTPRAVSEKRPFSLPSLTTCTLYGANAFTFFQVLWVPNLTALYLHDFQWISGRLPHYRKLKQLHLFHVHHLKVEDLFPFAQNLIELSLVHVTLQDDTPTQFEFPSLKYLRIFPHSEAFSKWRCPKLFRGKKERRDG
ncbi:hypothetical protein HMI56_000588 [Coelomomyces lativittatus]|nr:hypothetical protein HMI56_000588 [Coelomomyces lativittatus]